MAFPFFKKLKIKTGYYLAILVGIIFFAGVVYASTHTECGGSHTNVGLGTKSCYSADGTNNNPPSTPVVVNEWGEKLCVTNHNQLDILIPTNTGQAPNEWGKFKAAAANINVNVGSCNASCGNNNVSGGYAEKEGGSRGQAIGNAFLALYNQIASSKALADYVADPKHFGPDQNAQYINYAYWGDGYGRGQGNCCDTGSFTIGTDTYSWYTNVFPPEGGANQYLNRWDVEFEVVHTSGSCS